MKLKYLALLTLALTLFTSIVAAPVSRRQAQQQAAQFFQKKGKSFSATPVFQHKMKAQGQEENAYYYVFNADDNQGFVVMSGDDRTDAVLGYADEGTFVVEDMPENLRAWLEGYADQIKWMDEHNYKAPAVAPAIARVLGHNVKTSIAPLLTCNWNQGAPYNLLCPEYSSGNRSVTGCVATAMSQVMYYHKRPLSTTATIPGYTTDSRNLTVSSKPITSFDWAHMKDNYDGSGDLSDVYNNAVATLMAYVGAAMEMDYGPSSGAVTSWAPGRLSTYFGFDKDVKWANRNDYNYADWVNLVYDELSRGPVLYSGQSAGGGHAFVCDGYAENDYFHINWGWGGSSNGYFKLSVLSPSSQGIGGSSTNDGYGFMQGVMYNVHPEDDGVDEVELYGPRLTLSNLNVAQHSYTRSNTESNFAVKISYSIFNNQKDAYSFDSGVGVFKDGNLLSVGGLWTTVELGNGWGYNNVSPDMSFGAGLPDGEYVLAPVCRRADVGDYQLDINAEQNYVIATISGTDLQLALSRSSELSANLTLASGAFTNMPISINADVECLGDNYSGDVILCWKWLDGSTYRYTRLGGTQIEKLTKGEHQTVNFSFTLKDEGVYTVVLVNYSGYIVGDLDVTVTSGSYPTYVSTTITNAVGGQLYGQKAMLQATFSNTSGSTFDNDIDIKLADNYTHYYVQSTTVHLNIPNGQSRTVDFEFDGLTYGHGYVLSYFDYNSGSYSPTFTPQPGIDYYRTNGTKETVAPSSSFIVPNDVLTVDISELSTISSITPNSNPNTVYYVKSGSEPSGLTGKNVVKNGVAAQLNLTDGYGFYAPKAFTATTARYTRTINHEAEQNSGWSTLVLPFTPTSVQANSTAIDWAHNDGDTEKPFWLMQFVSDEPANIGFDYATSLTANTPYLVGVKASLVNQPIVFSASNVAIDIPLTTTVTGSNYLFTGSFEQKTANGFFLNNAGTAFNANANGTVQPFRAYFRAADAANATTTLPLDLGLPTSTSPNIVFADAKVKAICVDHWDTNGDGELSEAEAAAVTDLGMVFKDNYDITSFNELQYFTGLTSIGDHDFGDCKSLTSITIPNSVTNIGNWAFSGCSGLISVTIPNSVTSIGEYAFYGCSGLSSITISNSVTSIHNGAFIYCPDLTSITVDSKNTVYDSRDNCNAIIEKTTNALIAGCQNTVIPNSVTSIGNGAFCGSSGLTSLTIPNSVTSIGDNAFTSCSGLISVTIPNSVTSIGEYAFQDCSGLTSITIPSSVTSIGAWAFSICSGLTSITFPNSVTSIGEAVLYGCSGLISVAIPNSLTSIGAVAFCGCSSLTSIIIPNSVTNISKSAFSNCYNLTTVVVQRTTPLAIGSLTFDNCTNATLYVPKNSKPAYQSAIYWKDFKAIKEFPDADVNQDGVVNVVDVVDIARYVVDDPSPSFDKFLADLNGSGEVSVTDAVVLVNEIAGETSWARRSEQSTAANDQLLLFANADNSLSLHLEGDGQYTAFQLDLHLPADVDLTKALLNAQRKQKHQLLYNKVGEGVYRIIGLSTSGRTFLGNAGELLNMQLDDFATEDIMMDNIHFITPAAADVLFEPVMLTTETTGIAAVNKTDGVDHRVVYNLNGQRIAAPQKGLNIVNGKKLIVK